MSRLHKIVKIPHEITISFALFMMKDSQQRAENDKERNKFAKLTAQFIKSFTKNDLLDMSNYLDDLEEFINMFIHVEEVVGLKKFIQKQKDWVRQFQKWI